MLNNNLFSSLEEKPKKKTSFLSFLKDNLFSIINSFLIIFLFLIFKDMNSVLISTKIHSELLEEINVEKNEMSIYLLRLYLNLNKDVFNEKRNILKEHTKNVTKAYEEGLKTGLENDIALEEARKKYPVPSGIRNFKINKNNI